MELKENTYEEAFPLFENAYFGKLYETRDGRKALYAEKHESGMHYLIVDGYCDTITYLNNGTVWDINKEHNLDIIREWTIDEEILDKMAYIEFYTDEEAPYYENDLDIYTSGYKAGFRAKEAMV